MVVETSAIVCILQRESGFRVLLEKMASASSLSMSVTSRLEAVMVLAGRRGDGVVKEIDDFISNSLIIVLPVSKELSDLAVIAFLLYGKGRHPAKLNFGDCLSYALAKHLNESLLYIGDDFSLTDIIAA